MLFRSDMLKEIERALKDAAYADVRKIYMFLVGAGLIKEEEEYERED
jgi:translation elongation factor EF-Ts